MKFKVTLRKNLDKRQWKAESTAFNLSSDGKSKLNAIEKLIEGVEDLMLEYYQKGIELGFILEDEDCYFHTHGDSNVLLGLSLRCHRERAGLTPKQAADRIEARTAAAYIHYETGRAPLSMTKYEQILHALDPEKDLVITLKKHIDDIKKTR